MHGRREGGGEGCGKGRLLVRHMWPVTRVEAAPPSAQGQAPPPPPRSCAPPPLKTSCPPAPTTPPAAAHRKERVDSPRPASPDSFVKDGREFRVGDCALFRAVDAPPFIGLIRWIEKQEEGYPKLRVSWLYRCADIKLGKGIQLDAAPNEIFYSFHQDEASAVSLLHPCKVAFLRKGSELPTGTSSFVCWRVYDIDNKCLWWLTDQDYINERQEEVNQLLLRTRLDMHTAVQQGGRSPKRLNAPPASQQLKAGSDNFGSSKGKKRERSEQGIDPAKRDRDRSHKTDDGELGNLKVDNIKSEIAKITEKDGLLHAEAVEKLVHLLHLDRTERKLDFTGRVMLADIIAATECPESLEKFVQLRGLPVLDDWIQEAHKGKSGDGGSPKETDKPIEELLLAMLRALAKLPISLTALQSCSIGKSVNHLRSHKNLEIQRKAKCLVDSWKKRVDAEMKSIDAKPVVPGQAVCYPGKPGCPEISNAGSRRISSSETSLKNQVTQLSSPKAGKPDSTDSVVKLSTVVSGSSKLQHMQPANVVNNLKEPPCKSNGGSELPTVKEEKSSSSSQSLNNSQSYSSEHAKTIGSWKEDARSSTAASGNASKTSGSSSRGHRRTNNGRLGSGIHKEATAGGSVALERSSLQEKSSQSGMACEKGGDTPSENGNNHRLIVRIPNPGRSPARSASGGSFEDPSVTGSRSSSPVHADKHEQNDRRVKMKTEKSRPQLPSDTNAESWHSNDIKGAAGSEEGDKSTCVTLEDDRSRTAEEPGKDACVSRVACSSYTNEKGVCSSETRKNSFNPMNALIEIKYSKTDSSLLPGDDTDSSLLPGDDTLMNLLARVAGEISKSELTSPSSSPKNSSANEAVCEGDNTVKLKVECDVGLSKRLGPSNDIENVIVDKQEQNGTYLTAKEESHRTNLLSRDYKSATSTGPSPLSGTDSKAVESSAKTENQEDQHTKKSSSLPVSVMSQAEDRKACNARGEVQDAGSIISNRKSELLPADETSLCAADKQAHALLKSADQKQLVGPLDHSEAIDKRGDGTAGKLDLKSSFSSAAVNPKKAAALGVHPNAVLKEDEKREQISSTSADFNKLAVSSLGPANGIKDSKDSSSESSDHVKPRGVISQGADHSTRHSSEKSSNDTGRKEDLILSDEGSSLAPKVKSTGTAKLDFDLNEGIPGDEGHQPEAATPLVKSSSFHLPSISPFMSSVSSGLPAPITVAAPAKGPFVPPENLLRVKPETGWKGSAATSAFRPAEPRRILEFPLTSPDTQLCDAAGKRPRRALDIDLNVADDQVLDENVSQSSARTTGSESGNTRSRDAPVRSAGIEFDLNRDDEIAENGQFLLNASHRVEAPLIASRSLPGVFSCSGTNSLRNFDLNNGPTLDEVGTEPAARSLSCKNTSSIPFLPQVAGNRMNSSEMGNISPWLTSANPSGPVAIQSFLPSRGEQPHPIEIAPGSGTHRIITNVADGGQLASACRTPVISTSPAMVFHPPPYQYTGFPFAPGVHLPAPGFSIGSTSYANSAPTGVPYFPTIAPMFVGPAGALPAQHARQYAVNLPEGSGSVGHDGNWRWGRQGFDLNSGPGSIDVENKDERVPLPVRQNLMTPPHAFVEEHTRMYQVQGVGIKRKEPEGSWDAERSSHKQLSWQ